MPRYACKWMYFVFNSDKQSDWNFLVSADDTVYNVTNPDDCSGAMYVGICLKAGVDGVCNPEPEDTDE